MGNVWGRVWGGTKKFFFELWNRHPASRSLYEFLDRDVDPCDNFYQFSCGKWIRTMELDFEDSDSVNTRVSMTNFNKFREEAMEGKYNDESSAIHNIYKLYGKCKDLSEDEIGKCQGK
uniref:Peptidase_M13_N domain-containing protein n=1 Tax=Strongyloides papillosus TaxID=174720 RepID=A0A0N5BYH5_STREA